jgi:hypothetical protein
MLRSCGSFTDVVTPHDWFIDFWRVHNSYEITSPSPSWFSTISVYWGDLSRAGLTGRVVGKNKTDNTTNTPDCVSPIRLLATYNGIGSEVFPFLHRTWTEYYKIYIVERKCLYNWWNQGTYVPKVILQGSGEGCGPIEVVQGSVRWWSLWIPKRGDDRPSW